MMTGLRPNRWAVLALLSLAMTTPAFAQSDDGEAEANGRARMTGAIDAVTVYRGQAMVTRKIEVPEAQGLTRVIVESLPAEIVGGSIYAEAGDGLTIRSVRYRTRPVREDVRKQVRELDQKIAELEKEIEKVETRRATLADQKTLIQKLEQFTAPSADWELSHGVLDAKTLQSLTEFLFAQRKRIDEERLDLSFVKDDLQQELDQLQREREELTRTSSKTMREAVVFLEGQGDSGTFYLRYLVENATWSPSYNVRGPASRDSVNLEYLASIRQTSGEDWNDVRMTLSTASPSLVAEPPELASLSLTLSQQARDAARLKQAPQQALQYRRELASQQEQLQRQRATAMEAAEDQQAQSPAAQDAAGDGGGGFTAPTQGLADDFDKQLNALSAKQQLLDVVQGRTRDEQSPEETRPRDAQRASVRYELAGRTSLPSRDDPQLVRITDNQLEAEFFRVARPVLTENVYEQAKLTNTLDWVLLAGPSNSYLDGEFVGRGRVPGVAVGESFKAGFGIDSSLRAERELVKRDESTQGGNAIVRITYRLSLANFADQPGTVRLFDRLPVPNRGEDVQVELVSTSRDPVTSPANDKGRIEPTSDGIIRWDVEVPAGAASDDKTHVDYTFTMEYDRQKEIDIQPRN